MDIIAEDYSAEEFTKLDSAIYDPINASIQSSFEQLSFV